MPRNACGMCDWRVLSFVKSVYVCGLFCVVTFTELLTCLREVTYDCPAFADSPHLPVVGLRVLSFVKSVYVCGLFCVVTFTELLTCLREVLHDCPAFADSPHLPVPHRPPL